MALIQIRKLFSHYEKFHWRQFNRMSRIGGLFMVFGSIIPLGWGVFFLLHPESPLRQEGPIAIHFVVGALLFALGMALLRSEAFRPDLGDSFFGRARDIRSSKRSWWTGEPRREN